MTLRVLAAAALAALLSPVAPAGAADRACVGRACGGTLVLIGTQTGGPGQGIFAARLDTATGALAALGLAAEIERPTWLTRDPEKPIVYAASETGDDGKSQGGVYSLVIDRGAGRLAIRSRVDSGGGGAAQLAYDPRLRTVFVANYGGGQVAAIPVGADGALSPVVASRRNVGSGPDRRQASAHAHGVTVDISGRYVLSPDLGADKVFVYRWDGARRTLSPAPIPFARFAPGSGPRHLAFARGRFAFVAAELTGQVHALRWSPATGRLRETMHVALDPPGFAGTRSAAELATSRDGRYLYVANRGANALQVFAIDRLTGALSQIQRIDCGGEVPWSFGIDPGGRWLVVANQGSSSLYVFEVDRFSGRLTATGQSLAVPRPVAVAFVR